MMSKPLIGNKPYVLTVAGFDPSSGAGLTSDIKTFDAHQVYGLSVCTAITVQNDLEFQNVTWMTESSISDQLHILFKRFQIDVMKIGLIENMERISQVIHIAKTYQPTIKIVWDPILKASAGFLFHQTIEQHIRNEILQHMFLITPNLPEAEHMFGSKTTLANLPCAVLLKGGHSEGEPVDTLYDEEVLLIRGNRIHNTEKHGTGCVLSAAICAHLAKKRSLKDACTSAKNYIEAFILSNSTHLGDHIYSGEL